MLPIDELTRAGFWAGVVSNNGRIVALSNEIGHECLPHRPFLQFICSFAGIPDDAIVKVLIGEEDERPLAAYACAADIRRQHGEVGRIAWNGTKWAKDKASQLR
jgi:hypothetical protein